jgi:fructokinase
MVAASAFRIGIDLGGTKIAGIVFDPLDRVLAETRRPAPRHDYAGTVQAIAEVVTDLRQGRTGATIGIGMPGSISPRSGLVQNANSVWINRQPFQRDLETALGQQVRLSNDANCFALSEAHDGAAKGAKTVFGVIIGTGVGGGIVANGALIDGPHGMAGEWGHTPLPWSQADECPGPACWCGRHSCMETWVSGPGLAADHTRVTGVAIQGETIAERAAAGDLACQATLQRYTSRLARGLAQITNILDPEVIVLGGGLSQLGHLYRDVPPLMQRYMFTDHPAPDLRAPTWGDASGVRGAARLWP